jgi:hypothetical protein
MHDMTSQDCDCGLSTALEGAHTNTPNCLVYKEQD